MTWKKSFSPPPTSTSHAYNWESPHQPPPLTRINEHKRDREKRSDSHRSRESRRNAEQLVSTKATVSEAAPLEDGRSSASTEEVVPKPLPPVQSDGEAEEARPLSAVVEVDESIEGFSDFSDDVDEILNRDIQVDLHFFLPMLHVMTKFIMCRNLSLISKSLKCLKMNLL